MAEATPPRLVVKIGSDGGVHLDFKRANLELMEAAVSPTPAQPKQRVLVGGPLKEGNEDTFFKAMDLVIRAARVLEMQQQAPELAMDDQTVALPSLHLRLAYAARRWASVYRPDEIPANIASFERDLWWLASQTFAYLGKDGRELSGQAALELFNGPMQT